MSKTKDVTPALAQILVVGLGASASLAGKVKEVLGDDVTVADAIESPELKSFVGEEIASALADYPAGGAELSDEDKQALIDEVAEKVLAGLPSMAAPASLVTGANPLVAADLTELVPNGKPEVDGTYGGYALGTGEWRGTPQHTGMQKRGRGGRFPRKIDERYSHATGIANRTFCFGADEALAKMVGAEMRANPNFKLEVGSVLTMVHIPELHAVSDLHYFVDRVTPALDGFGFKVVFWWEEEATGKRFDGANIPMSVEPYTPADGAVYRQTETPARFPVDMGLALKIGIEITSLPANVDDFMQLLRQTKSPEQFRLTVGVAYMQVRPQVDEGKGDQYIRGMITQPSYGSFAANPNPGDNTNYED